MAEKNWLDEDSSSGTFALSPDADHAGKITRHCCVLVIEDDLADFELIVANLVKTNGVEFQYARAARLAEGLKCLARGGVHVVLLDLDLPDSRGLWT